MSGKRFNISGPYNRWQIDITPGSISRVSGESKNEREKKISGKSI